MTCSVTYEPPTRFGQCFMVHYIICVQLDTNSIHTSMYSYDRYIFSVWYQQMGITFDSCTFHRNHIIRHTHTHMLGSLQVHAFLCISPHNLLLALKQVLMLVNCLKPYIRFALIDRLICIYALIVPFVKLNARLECIFVEMVIMYLQQVNFG